MAQLWKDARRGRVILCDDRAGTFSGESSACPSREFPR
jgi:hypothetical protein